MVRNLSVCMRDWPKLALCVNVMKIVRKPPHLYDGDWSKATCTSTVDTGQKLPYTVRTGKKRFLKTPPYTVKIGQKSPLQ